MRGADPFEERAAQYDAWYDTPRGRRLFDAEVSCLAPLLVEGSPRLEVGVGSGRFAAALGVECGFDLAPAAVALAARRGVHVAVGDAESLPFAAGRFAAVLVVATLCFVEKPARALEEAHRVLAPGGRIVLATIARDSELGERYEVLARAGHPFYSRARFQSVAAHVALLDAAGFDLVAARSTLLTGTTPGLAREGVVPGAGFVALAGVASRHQHRQRGE